MWSFLDHRPCETGPKLVQLMRLRANVNVYPYQVSNTYH